MKNLEYDLISGTNDDTGEFIRRVDEMLENGWSLYGNIVVNPVTTDNGYGADTTLYYTQAVTRETSMEVEADSIKYLYR